MIETIVVQGKKVDTDRARRIAERFECEVTNEIPNNKDAMYFVMDKTGISFVARGQVLKGDFTRLLNRVTGGHLQHEILLKVAGDGQGLRAVDATAGLGEDSFILAAGGFDVELFEHNPVTATLLKDALVRGNNDPKLRDITRKMVLKEGDSKELMQSLSYVPDIIYLDPMFPEKKKSAETKKKLQVLHKIELPCSDEVELLETAMTVKPGKIIIKRPPGCENLAGVKPTYVVERKAVRFDCIVQ